MYKIAALDLDGTLLDDKGLVSEHNARALNEFARKGGIVVLASGRMTPCISPCAEVMGIDCPVISYNGAMVRLRESEMRRMIYHNPLDPSDADTLVDYCARNGFLLNYYLDDTLYAQESSALKQYVDIYSTQTGAVYRFVHDLSVFSSSTPTKLIIVTDVENDRESFRTRDAQYAYLRGKISGKTRMLKTNPEYLEFMNTQADKGKALAQLADFYSVPREDIIAFGDGENDIEMLKYAGIGVVPANANAMARRYADEVLEWSNSQSAVAMFLERIL